MSVVAVLAGWPRHRSTRWHSLDLLDRYVPGRRPPSCLAREMSVLPSVFVLAPRAGVAVLAEQAALARLPSKHPTSYTSLLAPTYVGTYGLHDLRRYLRSLT